MAMFTASSGEYKIRTSAPFAFASIKLIWLPGTRIISPKEQRITFFPQRDARLYL